MVPFAKSFTFTGGTLGDGPEESLKIGLSFLKLGEAARDVLPSDRLNTGRFG